MTDPRRRLASENVATDSPSVPSPQHARQQTYCLHCDQKDHEWYQCTSTCKHCRTKDHSITDLRLHAKYCKLIARESYDPFRKTYVAFISSKGFKWNPGLMVDLTNHEGTTPSHDPRPYGPAGVHVPLAYPEIHLPVIKPLASYRDAGVQTVSPPSRVPNGTANTAVARQGPAPNLGSVPSAAADADRVNERKRSGEEARSEATTKRLKLAEDKTSVADRLEDMRLNIERDFGLEVISTFGGPGAHPVDEGDILSIVRVDKLADYDVRPDDLTRADSKWGPAQMKPRYAIVLATFDTTCWVLWLTTRGGRGDRGLPPGSTALYLRATATNTASAMTNNHELRLVNLNCKIEQPDKSLVELQGMRMIDYSEKAKSVGSMLPHDLRSLLTFVKGRDGPIGKLHEKVGNCISHLPNNVAASQTPETSLSRPVNPYNERQRERRAPVHNARGRSDRLNATVTNEDVTAEAFGQAPTPEDKLSLAPSDPPTTKQSQPAVSGAGMPRGREVTDSSTPMNGYMSDVGRTTPSVSQQSRACQRNMQSTTARLHGMGGLKLNTATTQPSTQHK